MHESLLILCRTRESPRVLGKCGCYDHANTRLASSGSPRGRINFLFQFILHKQRSIGILRVVAITVPHTHRRKMHIYIVADCDASVGTEIPGRNDLRHPVLLVCQTLLAEGINKSQDLL